MARTGTTLQFVFYLRFFPYRSGLVRFCDKGQANAVIVPRVGRKVSLYFMCFVFFISSSCDFRQNSYNLIVVLALHKNLNEVIPLCIDSMYIYLIYHIVSVNTTYKF